MRFTGIAASICLLALPQAARAISAEDLIGSNTIISLDEAVALALQNNLDLEVARIEPALAEQRVREASGSFDPEFFGDADFEHTENQVASTVLSAFGTGNVVNEDIWTYGTGLRGQFPWGIEYLTQVGLQRVDSTSGFTALKPEWRSTWENRLTVPLLKDLFRNDAYLAVKTSRLGDKISQEDFERELDGIVLRVVTTYWALTAARAQERVEAKSLEAAQNLLDQTNTRYEVGVVSRVEVTEAEAGVAEREFSFIQARNAANNAEDALLNLVLAPDMRAYATTRLGTQEPGFLEYEVDEAVAMERALAQRPDLRAAAIRVEQAEIELAHARNQKLPELDLSGSFRFTGLSGDPETPPFGNSSYEAFDDYFEASGAHSWSVGANLAYPLGNETAQSRHVQRKIELRRATTELRRKEQEVILDVREAVRNVQDSMDGVRAAERRKASEAERLRAEQERLRLGDSTPQEVLEIEEDLTEAESQEIAALQAYFISISELERAQSTLLERRGITVERALGRQ
jgi:outer membrane protein TolC